MFVLSKMWNKHSFITTETARDILQQLGTAVASVWRYLLNQRSPVFLMGILGREHQLAHDNSNQQLKKREHTRKVWQQPGIVGSLSLSQLSPFQLVESHSYCLAYLASTSKNTNNLSVFSACFWFYPMFQVTEFRHSFIRDRNLNVTFRFVWISMRTLTLLI